MKNCNSYCIELTGKNGRGKVAIVDADTYKKYGHLRWHLTNWGYARRSYGPRGEVRRVLLHRLVMDAKDGEIVDHRNRNKLDNRRCNLRICSAKDNARNRSGVTGVSFDKSRNKWAVRYLRKFYGRYETKAEAEAAFKRARSGIEYPKTYRKRYMLPKGVLFMRGRAPRGKPYYARPQVNNRKVFLGYFATADEAKQAYDNYIRQQGG